MREFQRLTEPNGLPLPFLRVGTAGLPEAEPHPLRAGVRSFGIGSSNAHVVLQETPTPLAKQVSSLDQFAEFADNLKKRAQEAVSVIKAPPAVEWLERHGRDNLGLWVALDGGKLVASGTDGRKVYEKAKDKGCSKPLMVKVSDREDLPFGGW